MPLDTEVGLGHGHISLDVDSDSLPHNLEVTLTTAGDVSCVTAIVDGNTLYLTVQRT